MNRRPAATASFVPYGGGTRGVRPGSDPSEGRRWAGRDAAEGADDSNAIANTNFDLGRLQIGDRRSIGVNGEEIDRGTNRMFSGDRRLLCPYASRGLSPTKGERDSGGE